MYDWEIKDVVGRSVTLNDAIDSLIHYSWGKPVRDFYINGHNMNEEFGLYIVNNTIVDDEGSEFVACNKWYDILKKVAA